MEHTLSIIKPDATLRNITGKVNSYIEGAGLKIVAQKMMHLSRKDAEKFYEIHKARPFFNDLVNFMISGPVVVQVLKGENAVETYREIMGATNPSDAKVGTIRRDLSESIEANSVHGSDSLENAHNEIAFFFSKREIME
jgi:nucleoside-diphosphate kinase